MSDNSVYFIDNTTLEQILREKTALMIDVREPDEFASGTVAGALNIPLGALDMADLIDRTDDAGLDVVFICAVGQRSFGAANAALEHLDCKVMTLKGGLQSWARDGYLVKK
ncbi:rhodanese-like domain-containing protein [Thalassospira mesophila]|uniref:Sulfurtransferase n=1 Tax=Thalassospira mesophila TaxID=1293891 RepID=A0A1Y2KYG7_9PROT|nr:rhodanese-like domain-containing protein [Thalassospira mesophila]OSQ36077.1 sulfurtransferase [Thalassospira mesophila]